MGGYRQKLAQELDLLDLLADVGCVRLAVVTSTSHHDDYIDLVNGLDLMLGASYDVRLEPTRYGSVLNQHFYSVRVRPGSDVQIIKAFYETVDART